MGTDHAGRAAFRDAFEMGSAEVSGSETIGPIDNGGGQSGNA